LASTSSYSREQPHELFALLGRTEDEVAVHDARHAVVVGDGEGGGSLQTALAHEGSIAARRGTPPSPDPPIGVLSLRISERGRLAGEY